MATKLKIPGMHTIDLSVHSDERGWFKENWRKSFTNGVEPSFAPIQNNVSFNTHAGVTRGFHAEPWDKYVSVANGKVFGAWIDLREGDSFGQVEHIEISPSTAVFVPAGVANAFQALEDETTYIYLVNGYWDAEEKYVFVGLNDSTVKVPWPISLDQAVISAKDLSHPPLSSVKAFQTKKLIVLGAGGQVGKALGNLFPEALLLYRNEYDLASASASLPKTQLRAQWVLNAGAYTKVDLAESPEGRSAAWAANVTGVANLVETCKAQGLGLVHYSSDYVFDGASKSPHSEDEVLSPLNVYGATKAAGDAIVSTLDRHFIVRTTWVTGDGANFVKTMRTKALAGEPVQVVGDQIGRLTFAQDLALATKRLIESNAPSGIFNVTNSGPSASWCEIAKAVYAELGAETSLVTPITSEEFAEKFPGRAQRPLNSVMDLSKFEQATGHQMPDWRASLKNYLQAL